MTLVPRQRCGWIEGDSAHKVVVLQPRYGKGLLARFIQPRLPENKKFLRIPLEERGSFLWLEMDGRRSVGELAVAFGQKFTEDTESVPERVATYLYQMADNKLIEFVNLVV